MDKLKGWAFLQDRYQRWLQRRWLAAFALQRKARFDAMSPKQQQEEIRAQDDYIRKAKMLEQAKANDIRFEECKAAIDRASEQITDIVRGLEASYADLPKPQVMSINIYRDYRGVPLVHIDGCMTYTG